jgi:hypothetical protein
MYNVSPLSATKAIESSRGSELRPVNSVSKKTFFEQGCDVIMRVFPLSL